MEATPCPDDVVYVASEAALEATKSAEKFQEIYYGKLPIQVGYCNGHNSLLNALEYHRCGEVNVAVTDLIVLVGSLVDVADDFTYDTAKVEAFFVPAGTAFEMYETTLHYAPCGVDGKGFKDVRSRGKAFYERGILPFPTRPPLLHPLPENAPEKSRILLKRASRIFLSVSRQ